MLSYVDNQVSVERHFLIMNCESLKDYNIQLIIQMSVIFVDLVENDNARWYISDKF